MTNTKKSAFARAGRRIAAVTVIAAAALSIMGTAAQAQPRDGGWYRCYIEAGSHTGWYWCKDV
ncbi:hypothetical protein [Rhizohabitans arisaemae]|uniref:hypothetical protein n=1 Tax=Rhizohabitans arisaemae TaxID=2720610 RepID=UPI0024B12B8A|nr:hypothetical protein [Rhizohabitans arisaemae]